MRQYISNSSHHGNQDTPTQSPSNDIPPDTTKNHYEQHMASLSVYCRGQHQHGGHGTQPHAARGKSSALPSPTARVFIPSGSNSAAQAEAAKKFSNYLMNLAVGKEEDRKREEELKNLAFEKFVKASNEEFEKARQAVPSSPSGGSVGSWTGDDEFIPHIKK
ncbi:hypothetical protein N0V82_009404 [Gnomoniopsis sp. IMI 355080]|nr:hypothetical protein N0V82_009404 [Gnomoniopsis sp. IMI 355080]